MAIFKQIETGSTPEEYERVVQELDLGEGLPAGTSLHIAAVGEDGKVSIVEVWETRDQAEEFGDKVQAARDRIGVGEGHPTQVTYRDVHADRRS